MTVDILPSCLLSFNQEKTAEHPAKIYPDNQLVVFSNAAGKELTLTRAETYNLMGETEEENINKFGISTITAAKGFFKTDYSVLVPDNSI